MKGVKFGLLRNCTPEESSLPSRALPTPEIRYAGNQPFGGGIEDASVVQSEPIIDVVSRDALHRDKATFSHAGMWDAPGRGCS
jgi:hypothetical protein